MPDESLRVLRDGPVITLEINRPRRKNALDDHTVDLLQNALRQAADDSTVRVLVLTGVGEDFCSGVDVGAERRSGHPVDRMRWLGDTARLLVEFPKPVIARVTGVVVGAGCNLAIAADFVVATPESRFSQIFAKRGLSPDLGGSWLLPRTVGLLQAKRLALLAEIVDGREAQELGLVTWLVDRADLDSFVEDLALRLASGPPTALAQTKAMLNDSATHSLQQALDTEARVAAINLATDAMVARQAFVDKVEPQFEGRWQVPTGLAAPQHNPPAPEGNP